jgi:hypothetical protein
MRSVLTITIATLISSAAAKALTANHYRFIEYIAKYGKQYSNQPEFNKRLEAWMFIDSEIDRHNSEQTSSRHGHNEYSDWTQEEWANHADWRGDVKFPEIKTELQYADFALSNIILPTNFSWSNQTGYTQPVGNAGNCASAYAFAAAAAMETNKKINGGPMEKLSEQQIVSCSQGYGNYGCNGGTYEYAWYYSQNEPITDYSYYQYDYYNYTNTTSNGTMPNGTAPNGMIAHKPIYTLPGINYNTTACNYTGGAPISSASTIWNVASHPESMRQAVYDNG